MTEATDVPKKIFTKKRVAGGTLLTVLTALATTYLQNQTQPTGEQALRSNAVIQEEIRSLKENIDVKFDNLKSLMVQQHQENLMRYDRQTGQIREQNKDLETRFYRETDKMDIRIQALETSGMFPRNRTKNN